MCFSATASFAASGVLTLAGAATLRQTLRARAGAGLVLLSAFPLIFGVQQAVEGLVWLSLDERLPEALLRPAAYAFLFFALLFWPVAGPLAGWLLETRPLRRRLFAGLLAGGAAVGLYLYAGALSGAGAPLAPPEWGGHIVYLERVRYIPHAELIYFVTACAALIASSNRTAAWFGAALAASFAATAAGYAAQVLPSVWCFFAALCSLVIVLGLRRETAGELQTSARAGS
jgi:hypothetical protein